MIDYRPHFINAFALMFSFTNVESFLKITSLMLAIGFTIRQWYIMEKNKK